jgi:hypothetical protein
MTWEEIKSTYPNEWVAIANYHSDGAVDVSGEVILHDHNKEAFYSQSAKLLRKHKRLAVRYTGELVRNADVPLLWQISDTK